MKDISSGEEIALCAQSIFWLDVDSLTRNFGQADGGEAWKTLLYAYQAAQMKSHPALIGLLDSHDYSVGQEHVLQWMEDSGMTTLRMHQKILAEMIEAVPDTVALDDAGKQKMPLFVRYIRCAENIEDGGPCSQHKFNLTLCENRDGLVASNPGW
jgi:hypothetical protein